RRPDIGAGPWAHRRTRHARAAAGGRRGVCAYVGAAAGAPGIRNRLKRSTRAGNFPLVSDNMHLACILLESLPEEIQMSTPALCSEEEITRLVHEFYARVRQDSRL